MKTSAQRIVNEPNQLDDGSCRSRVCECSGEDQIKTYDHEQYLHEEFQTTPVRENDRELGRGRSGIVFRSRDESGRVFARKVFGASGLAKVVQYAFLGAPNPYAWNDHAIRCAFLRRRILAELVEFWFGSKVRVAQAYDHRWNAELRAHELSCELIDGRHVALHHPYNADADNELRDLTDSVMKPLQARLVEAGLDGLVWQAGRGNPVALNNFMREESKNGEGYSWVWIDLESGVPALIPMNPLDLICFYLPKSFAHRTPLFDDVNVSKLCDYIRNQRQKLKETIGGDRLRQLDENVKELAENQKAWKSLPRHKSSVSYQRARGSISTEQAQWYEKHPLRWYTRESLRAVRSMPKLFSGCIVTLVALIAKIQLGRMLKTCWRAMGSQAFRDELARTYVDRRISKWSDRNQITDRNAATLRGHLRSEESSSYLADFGVHLAVKPFVKLLQFCVVPSLWMMGLMDDVFVGLFFVAGGPAVRTLYTMGRIVQNAVRGREKPWGALLVGAIPVIGNVAFPLQIVLAGSKGHRTVAQFLLYDTFARLGRRFPIWGGQDTLPEHVFNRCPNLVTRLRRPEVSPDDAVLAPSAEEARPETVRVVV